MYIGRHVKYRLFLSDCYCNLNFLDRISKNPQISNLMKIRPVGDDLLFRADGRTDRHDEASSRFSPFCEKRLKTYSSG